MVPAPASIPVCRGAAGWAAKYSARVSRAASGGTRPQMGSRYEVMAGRFSGPTGAQDRPQLPLTMVVSPCRSSSSPKPGRKAAASAWRWMSMKPGVTHLPRASMTRAARAAGSGSTAAILPPDTATSAWMPGRPEPS